MKALYLILFLLLASCVSKNEQVEIKTDGIFIPVEFNIIGGTELGEFLVGDDTRVVEIRVKNNSKFAITSVVLTLDEDISAGMTYRLNLEGVAEYPGLGGTCGTSVSPNETCTIFIEYKPNISGNFTQKINFTYTNLVDLVEFSRTLTMTAGEPASLIFTNDQTNYNFGVVERTFRETRFQDLEVRNVGGLTAKDLDISMLNAPASDVFKIIENNCPTNLGIGEVCQLRVSYLPENFSEASPDGDIEIDYTGNIRFTFIRDPRGGLGSLNGYFSSLSTTIEAKIERGGLEQISFNELIVGNIQQKNIKLTNKGYKEGILRAINVYNPANQKVAVCLKAENGIDLVCRDPLNTNNSAGDIPLSNLPFRFKDSSNCIDLYSKMNYTRDLDGNLSESVITVAGQTDITSGDSCFFGVTFHPSITFQTAGNFNNYFLQFEFDSTWKNEVHLYNTDLDDIKNFNITEAPYISAAQLSVNALSYSGNDIPESSGINDNNYIFDFGRIALISDVNYKNSITSRLINNGQSIAEVESIQTGNICDPGASLHTITETSSSINDFYLSASHAGCTNVDANAGICDLRMDLAPLASSNGNPTLASEEENNNMFDENTDANECNNYKVFRVKYSDGSLYNDDLSLREKRELYIRLTGTLVRKAYLVYEDTSNTQGQRDAIAAGSTDIYHVIVQNVGTGGIPYLSLRNGNALLGTNQKNNDQAFPYEFVDMPTAQDGADIDCFDILTSGEQVPPDVAAGTNANSVLGAGQKCSLSVRMKLRTTDVRNIASYIDPFFSRDDEIYREHSMSPQLGGWEYDSYDPHSPENISFRYYDGDGISDIANGYSPDKEGYGNYFNIAGINDGLFKLRANLRTPAKLIPDSPKPLASALIYRPEIELQTIPFDSWGNAVSSATISEQFWFTGALADIVPGAPVVTSINSQTALSSSFDSSIAEYGFHAGAFPADGGLHRFSLRINKLGSFSAKVLEAFYQGDPEIVVSSNNEINFPVTGISSQYNSSKFFDFTVNTTNPGQVYSGIFRLSYENGQEDINGDPVVITKRIQIIAETTDAIYPKASVTYEDVIIEYDSATDTITETDSGVVNVIDTAYNTSSGDNVTFRAVKGSAIYDKKKFVLTNSGTDQMNNINVFFKRKVTDLASSNSTSGTGHTFDPSQCNGNSLNTNETCDFEIILDAGISEPGPLTRIVVVSYQIGNNGQYIQEMFPVIFEAAEPATLQVLSSTRENISDNENPGSVVQNSYGINFGEYGQGHIVLNSFPKNATKSLIVTNTALEKASFLSQYRDFVSDQTAYPDPGDNNVEIFNEDGVSIRASRTCFYGDDEGTLIPIDEQGFNSSSNNCDLNLSYTLDLTYAGRSIISGDNILRVSFYNNKRASTDTLFMHLKGFVEPNVVNSGLSFGEVIALDDRTASFSWDPMTPHLSDWGEITGYRVYYSKFKILLSNIFLSEENNVPFVDVPDNQFDALLTGLDQATYYYVKVVAKREFSGQEYISEGNLPRLDFVIPPIGSFYYFDDKVIIDTYLSPEGAPESGNKTDAIVGCSNEVSVLSKDGVTITKNKELIDTQMYDYIALDDDRTDYGGTPLRVIPIWMADNPVNIAPIFSPGFDPSVTSANKAGTDLYYQKPCGDNSCNVLSKFIGGDGEDLPLGATFYAPGNTSNARYRCFTSQ